MQYTLLLILFALYAISILLSFAKKTVIASTFQIMGAILHFAILVIRSVNAHHPPFTNMYESLLLLSFLLQFKFLVFQRVKSELIANIQRSIVFLLILVLCILSPESRAIRPVMPALNSFWMYIHVPSYLFAYVSLFSATSMAILHIFSKKSIYAYDRQMDLDVSLTFIFLAIGMFTGAIWGQLSWGNFWSWDPKETWAMINILVLSLYFYKNDRKTQSLVVLITALTVLFTFFGVTYLLSGLHSYS